jgi:hypothetical protein
LHYISIIRVWGTVFRLRKIPLLWRGGAKRRGGYSLVFREPSWSQACFSIVEFGSCMPEGSVVQYFEEKSEVCYVIETKKRIKQVIQKQTGLCGLCSLYNTPLCAIQSCRLNSERMRSLFKSKNTNTCIRN